jgi:hypothetical protein
VYVLSDKIAFGGNWQELYGSIYKAQQPNGMQRREIELQSSNPCRFRIGGAARLNRASHCRMESGSPSTSRFGEAGAANLTVCSAAKSKTGRR